MKNNKKIIFLSIAAAFFIAAASLAAYIETVTSRVVPILMYHSISDRNIDSNLSGLFVSPEKFKKQMEFLAVNHYNVVGPDKVIAYMTGREKMPPKTVVITADDGYYDFYENAYPVLKKYNLPATIFIVTDHIGMSDCLGWKELREMSGSGLIAIESHTKSHPWLPTVSVDEKKLHDELVVSKEILEDGLGKKVYYICYPNGAFNDLVKEAAAKAGYKGGFTTNPSKRSSINDIYAIRRLKMSSSFRPASLWFKVSKYYAWFKECR